MTCSLEGGVYSKDLGELTELMRKLNNETLKETGAKATLKTWNTGDLEIPTKGVNLTDGATKTASCREERFQLGCWPGQKLPKLTSKLKRNILPTQT